MSINGTNFKQNYLLYQLLNRGTSKSNSSLIDNQFSKSNINNITSSKGKDGFVKSSMMSVSTYDSLIKRSVPSTSQNINLIKTKYISQDILRELNSGQYATTIQGNIVECNGKYFRMDQIPKIDGTNLKEIKSENNIIDFGSNNYFKYVSSDGKEHLLYTSELGFIGDIHSEYSRVEGGTLHDEKLQRYASFWNYMMSKDVTYIGLKFSKEEVRSYLDEAGIKKGFFTVKMGSKEATQFLSESKYTGGVHSKERYDEQYIALTSTSHLLSGYAPGDVFKIDGKEYVLNEAHNLDIPYGEDIYNIEYPSNYSYGKRID